MAYDRRSYGYQIYWHGREYQQRIEHQPLRRLLPLLSHPRWFIDFGGGFGRNAGHYRNAAAHYVIVDYSATNLTNAGELLADDLAAGRCFLVRADLNALPFVDAAFDAAIVVRVLHHLPDIERTLAEMGRTVGDRWLIDALITHHAPDLPRGVVRREGDGADGLAPPAAGTRTDPSSNLQVAAVRRLLSEHGWQTWVATSVNNMRRWDLSLPPLPARALPPAAQLAKVAAQPGGRDWRRPSQFLLAQRPTLISATLAAMPEHVPAGVPALATRMACPACRGPLSWTTETASCLACFATYPRTGTYWDFTIPAGQPATVGSQRG
jgi:SAM-dependent methyltransferase